MPTMLPDLHIWMKAKELAKEIYLLTKNKHFERDRGLRDQLRRAVISISSNIAEGYYRSGKGEFKYFLKVAKGSCGELISQILIIKELCLFEDTSKTNVLSRMIGRLISSLNKKS